MSGGEISGNAMNNTSGHGGGVFVASGGTFTVSGGEISGNTAAGHGGGVYVNNGTFTMSGGEISGNTAAGQNGGGGVYVYNGTFTKTGGGVIRGDADRVHSPGETANTATHVNAKGHAIGNAGGFSARQADVLSSQDVSISKSGDEWTFSPVWSDTFWDWY
jgi:hypothetical protein